MRVIFIDIDGPIINTPCYFVDKLCSVQRTVMNTQAIGYVLELAKLAEAKVVCNSTHNAHVIEDEITGNMRDLKTDLIYWGMKPEVFHEDWKTTFPYPDDSRFSEHSPLRRMRAINQWLEKNGDHDWVCFDDEYFTPSPNLILVDFETGIDYAAFTKACEFWEIPERILI